MPRRLPALSLLALLALLWAAPAGATAAAKRHRHHASRHRTHHARRHHHRHAPSSAQRDGGTAGTTTGGGSAAPGSAPAASTAAPRAWAPAAGAPIHPGVQTDTGGAQCTANFVFTDGTDVLLGQAAHCSGTGQATDTDGCTSATLPEGTAVQVDGASTPGVMVYNSWVRMQQAGEKDAETCAYNDLALIRLSPEDAAKVNPSVPFWGGPTGVGTTAPGEQVYSYGNSSLRQGIEALSPKTGATLQASPGGWEYDVETASPGIPGDSGSAFLNASGQATGILSTLEVAPLPGANGVGDLGHELAYARAHGLPGLALVDGTEPFSGTS